MNDVAGQNCFYAVYHKKWCESGSTVRLVRSPQSTESSSSTQCVSDFVRDRTSLGLMPLIIRPFAVPLDRWFEDDRLKRNRA